MNEKKIALLYYSRTGNTKKVAKYLKDKIEKKNKNVDLIPIIAERRPGFFKAISAARNQETLPIKNKEITYTDYHTLIFAVPSWAYYPAPFYKTIVKKVGELSNKRIALVLCAGVSIERNMITMKRFKDEIEHLDITPIADLILIVRKKEIIDGTQDVDAFIDTITMED